MRRLTLTSLVAIAATVAIAAPPEMIRYQSRLTDAAGVPVTGMVDLTFTIYDAASGGSALWTESSTAVSVVDGQVDAILGSTTPIAASVFDAADRWLEVSVAPVGQGAITLAPRQVLTSVPYAHVAGSIEPAGINPQGDGSGLDADLLDGRQRTEIEVRYDADSRNTAAPFNAIQNPPPPGIIGNTAFGHLALAATTGGSQNVAVGSDALGANTNGNRNNAFGSSALSSNTIGVTNSAIGRGALTSNTSGSQNIAIGEFALRFNVIGSQNVGIGEQALANSTGGANTAVGYRSLENVAGGTLNTALGHDAGRNLDTDDGHNVMIASQGVAGDSQTIRIGDSQTRAFVAGVRDVTPGGADAIPVVIDSNGQLGTAPSSGVRVAAVASVQPNNTAPIAAAASYDVVDLNTLSGDSSFISLDVAGSRLTLAPGTYVWESSIPVRTGSSGTTFKSRLRDITAGSTLLLGPAVIDRNAVLNGENDSVMSIVDGTFTLAVSSDVELQLRASGTPSSYGVTSNFGEDEIFATVKVTKIGD